MLCRSKRLAAVTVAATTAATIALAAPTPAAAISRVSCGTRTDFLKFRSSSPTCWQNAGSVSVGLYGVWGYSAGNNAGYFTANGSNISFAKWSGFSYTQTKTVTFIRIN